VILAQALEDRRDLPIADKIADCPGTAPAAFR